MTSTTEVKVPNIGDFEDVVVIEVLVSEGDTIKKEDPLITLESDKASMDVPAPVDGVVKKVLIAVDDTVSEGTPILVVETSGEAASDDAVPAESVEPSAQSEPAPAQTESQPQTEPAPDSDYFGEVVVLGGGPGGYTAVFRAADLGKKVILIERYPVIGGVCLNVGCIPSKVLLHMAKIIDEAMEADKFGIGFNQPKLELDKIQQWKNDVVAQLRGGLASMAKQRKITVIEGTATFNSSRQMAVETTDGIKTVGFDKAIIAAGSQAIRIPGLPDDDRIITSTGALSLQQIPKRMLIIGGGVIGLEMATVYHTFGSEITIVEALNQLIPGADPDLIRPLQTFVEKKYRNIFLETRVSGITAHESGIKADFEGKNAPASAEFDMVLVAVGRRPNSKELNLEQAQVETDGFGFIKVDNQLRTTAPNIFAIGDIVGAPMLAHKASHEGKIAAEVACGMNSMFDAVVIPAIAYTDPEIAWAGITEREAKEKKLEIEKAVFPWSASGRSLTMGRKEGKTKIIFEKSSGRVIGAGIVGSNASELISQIGIAIEMGSTAEDLSLIIYPHPTLSESISYAAEIFEGTITDLYMPKRKKT